jgi:hypothetical protein
VAAILVAALVVGCAEKITEPGPPNEDITGTIQVQLAMSGHVIDPNGCTISLDRGHELPIGAGKSLVFNDLKPGVHSLKLANVELGCVVAGTNPRSITVLGGQTAKSTFRVYCLF